MQALLGGGIASGRQVRTAITPMLPEALNRGKRDGGWGMRETAAGGWLLVLAAG